MDPGAFAQQRDLLVTLGVVVDGVRDEADLNVQDVGYIIRAVLRTVQWWLRDSAASFRQRNGIQMINGHSLSLAHFQVSPTSDRASSGVKLQCEFRDAFPD